MKKKLSLQSAPKPPEGAWSQHSGKKSYSQGNRFAIQWP